MQTRLCLTCDDTAAGYLKAVHATSSPRPEIVPLPARLIRAPIASAQPKHGLPPGGGKTSLPPAVEPDIAGVFSRLGEVERCEFYIDPDPNSQLLMTLLLTRALAAGIDHRRLFLVHASARWGQVDASTLPERVASPTQVEERHLSAAASFWSAYCAPTPEAWLGLRHQDMALFPFLENARDALLDDLPRRDTGLGACERLALETIGIEGAKVNELFGAFYREPARLIDLPQIVSLLSSLASGAAPLIDGLEGRLGADDFFEDADAWDRFRESRVRLTDVGHKILAGELDFVETHGIDRWWGGTRLTGRKCWRWDHRTRSLAHPAED
ncbi:hypothetical protein J5N58_14645 [Rhizobium cremeum]|uniref:DUF1835 domain-containing protein n=1 Tax=Ciceribacter sichuanensis TaxID=2949647 RepID=A0ABT0VA09_9HYPH|nr:MULTISPECIES: hypothetical protein [Rhizobiaceae]MCJ7995422.1 hypothetical protein [Rhizobium cremeum]MCJ8000920.1 hypothetical protein [Rhizobium cremeum]MCM2402488.1 hypothetical protein [Ciceribacter sp. S153]